jgi:hypothetical protein
VARAPLTVLGVDFTSAPHPAKPITVAAGALRGAVLDIERIERLESLREFEQLLARPGPWVGGFDFPFGLPREAVRALGWPERWEALVRHCASLGRNEFKRALDAYRESRPAGKRYATRRGDAASGAHPAVKLVHPPVGLMFLEGAPRLAAAGVTVPALAQGDPARVALEAFPGFLVRRKLGERAPYKNDQRAKQTDAQRAVRRTILGALEQGRPLGLRLRPAPEVARRALEDGTGDPLDALVCALQAAWGWRRRASRYGLPRSIDAVEGWIVTA